MEDIIMKKIYQAPTIDMVVYHHESPLLANTTPHQGGEIFDGTIVDTGGEGSDGDTGDAKQRNLWDAWDD